MHQPLSFSEIDPLGADRSAYLGMHQKLFPRTALTSQWLDWYHCDVSEANGIGRSRHYGVHDNGELVGIWGVQPRYFALDSSQVIPVGYLFAVGVHEDYRGQGLFTELSRFAIDQERKRGDLQYILAFPQKGRPVVRGHLRAGWKQIGTISAVSLSSERMDLRAPLSTLQQVRHFASFESHREGSFVSTASYLDLRWLKHPDNQYLAYQYGDAFIVLKPYGDSCHLLELGGEPKDVHHLLRAAATLARRHGWHELNGWCSAHEVYREEMLQSGFQPGSARIPDVLFMGVEIAARAEMAMHRQCHLPLGIEEAY